MPHQLQIENLSVEYRLRRATIQAVKNFSLTLERGESFGLVGESGCGKSTVAMAIMRHLGPFGRITDGRILLDGQDLATADKKELQRLRGAKLAMVYQEASSALNPSMTIGRQLQEVLVHKEGLTPAQARRPILDILSEVRIADAAQVIERHPHQLSGGQQQRIVIAMALLANPSLLILDEPTTALDVTVQAAFTDLLVELRRKYNTTLIYISHNLGVINRVCDRVGVMYLGELVEEGRAAATFARPRHPYTHGLLACIPRVDMASSPDTLNAIPGQASLPPPDAVGCRFGPRCGHFSAHECGAANIALVPAELERGELVPADATGHLVRCVRWREIDLRASHSSAAAQHIAPAEPGPVVLQVSDITKHYDQSGAFGFLSPFLGLKRHSLRANDGISFTARRGETVAIVGESGCGKSTLARLVMGLTEPSSGSIRFREVDLATLPVSSRDSKLIAALQMVFQNPDSTLNPTHTIGHTIERAAIKLRNADSTLDPAERVETLLRLVQLPPGIGERLPDQLSGGQKQRVAIARAFAGDPIMVVADEPVSALDVSVQAAIINLLNELQEEHGTTVIFISHDLGVVRSISDRVIVMYLGQIVEMGTVREVFEPPYHPYTEALLAACPVPDPDVAQRQVVLSGEAPSAINVPAGCSFAPRCHRKIGAICDTTTPPPQILQSGHLIRCHIPADALSAFGPIFQPKPAAIANPSIQ